jgi:two-component system phosphate regulon response regulator PhoB
MQTRILIIEDESEIREMVRFALEPKGYVVDEANDANEARIKLGQNDYDLILMDWMLPGRSGLDLTRELKHKTPQSTPIIMLTARTDESDKITGLDSGADDYVTKPFSTKELLARINAVIRRASSTDRHQIMEYQGLVLDHSKHVVLINNTALPLSPVEYRLLHFFMAHPNRAYHRSQLLDQVWGQHVYVDERTVDVHIRRLRKALTPSRHHLLIQTVRGTGYRFVPKLLTNEPT